MSAPELHDLRIERDMEPVAVEPDEKTNAEKIVTYNLRHMEPSWCWNGPPIPDRPRT